MSFAAYLAGKRMPVSLIFLLLAAGLLLVELASPEAGFILTILGFFVWFGVLVSLGMVGIAVETMVRKLDPRWLAIPLLYFGLYYAFYALERLQGFAKGAELGAANGPMPTFNPATDDLVLHFEGGEVASGESFVRKGYAPLVYSTMASRPDALPQLFMIGAKDACDLVRTDPDFRSRDFRAGTVFAGKNGPQLKDDCLVFGEGKPAKRQIIVSVAESKENGPAFSRIRTFHVRIPADGVDTTFQSNASSSLAPVPFPMAACVEGMGGCGFMFWRVSGSSFGAMGEWAEDDVAAMLGIKKHDVAPLAQSADALRRAAGI